MKRLWLMALVGGLVFALMGCADEPRTDEVYPGEMVDSSIISDSTVAPEVSACNLTYGIVTAPGEARVGTSIVPIPVKSEAWFCSSIVIKSGSEITPPRGTLVSWKTTSGETQMGILEEMPIVISVR